ncbi:similar to HCDI protein (predicted), isoform CRA_e [Rattus norvegicus]|uniref:Similar to HCDI protein (Predicted), isoform CRA_e n=1 Tax=Rattus norvegicus TaxID=10116 RepID=A6KH65_RAT|nr:similar to HCDI protein (predicted), isoform CRA_e [Rattus norvegicus]
MPLKPSEPVIYPCLIKHSVADEEIRSMTIGVGGGHLADWEASWMRREDTG